MATWITTPIESHLLRGALDLERTEHGVLPHRLPEQARNQFPDAYLTMVEAQPAGVRLAFRTRATTIELDVLPTRTVYQGFPIPPDGLFELLVDGHLVAATSVPGGTRHIFDMATQSTIIEPGAPGTARFTGLPDRDKSIEIWLPHTEISELITLRTDAPIEPAPTRGPVWLHHGSSISHGSNADRPTATWPAVAATMAGVELLNLGLRGNALLDPFVARTIRDTPADLISLKLGINLVNSDLMRVRAFTPAVHGFLDTIREGHPTTPLLVVSPILCPIQENTPGPGTLEYDGTTLTFSALGDPAEVAQGRLTLRVVRDELARIVTLRSPHDSNLHYLDGRTLYGETDFAELPLPDRLHPNTATHRRIGERFAEQVFTGDGPFHTEGA